VLARLNPDVDSTLAVVGHWNTLSGLQPYPPIPRSAVPESVEVIKVSELSDDRPERVTRHHRVPVRFAQDDLAAACRRAAVKNSDPDDVTGSRLDGSGSSSLVSGV
jgi:hypothetical protein